MSLNAVPCRECGVPIRFVTMLGGKRVAVEEMPAPDGRILARRVGDAYIAGVYILASETGLYASAPWVRFQPHSDRCTSRGRRRRKGCPPQVRERIGLAIRDAKLAAIERAQ